MSTIVKTQAQLDKALKAGDPGIIIDSPSGVWLEVSGSATVRASGSATVRAYGSATVRAFGSATVSASGSATVSASDSATVSAFDSATVSAYGSATVSAYGSATVSAFDSATVSAFDSATVRAFDSATVSAFDSATVSAYGSATVSASGSATVRAFGSATVSAFGSATVRAFAHAAVHLHSALVTHEGGVVIDVTKLDLNDVDTWVGYTGAETDGDDVLLYKAVDENLTAGQNYRVTTYPIGEEVVATDWTDNHECGGGLHASPHPHQALYYRGDAARMLVVAVAKKDLRPIPGGTAKAKARAVRVLREVRLDGRPL